MKTTALRIYGKNDLRLESFELPPLQDDEILAEVVSDSVCMSSHKAAVQGPDHKRVPDDVAQNPTIIGHEFAGYIRQVGKKWADKFTVGHKFAIQPAMEYKGSLDAPGYSFRYIGGMASYIVIPSSVMESDCLLSYEGDSFFKASLSEPMSCIVGAVHAQLHTVHESYEPRMGVVTGGNCAILAGAGPMGMGCIDYLVHGPRRPGLLVVTDIDRNRIERAKQLLTPEDAKRNSVELIYLDTSDSGSAVARLRDLTNGRGYDDVFVFAPVAPVVEQADAILGRNGCLNFFAGPTKTDFSARLNFYNVHYAGTHVVGTSGGNISDMREALELMSTGRIDPAAMITHVGGITCGAHTILHLPEIPGGKKLLYVQYDLPLVAIDEFAVRGKTDKFYADLADICGHHSGLWNAEAETYLLANAPGIDPASIPFRG